MDDLQLGERYTVTVRRHRGFTFTYDDMVLTDEDDDHLYFRWAKQGIWVKLERSAIIDCRPSVIT